jgi:EAL domain-containing protein (putative c-di-GMP-specific phosphodiesterase class I)
MTKTTMNSNFYAVIMGFNKFDDKDNLPELEFAEKDAVEFANVLTDPRYGNFPEENIKLVIGSPTQDEIETTLYTFLVKDRTAEDTVLFYYSGHGFIAGDNQDTFLGTPPATITQILNNPQAGLKMEYLYGELFLKSKARNAIFFLDCCHAGAFCPNFKGDIDREKRLVEDRYFTGEGRIAFVSSPKGVVSRESKQYQHGIFTYYLLKGMRREGINKHTGEVSIYQLIDYVGTMCPSTQKPIAYGKSTAISLYKPEPQILDEEPSTYQIFESSIFLSSELNKQDTATPLANPIEKQLEYIEILLEKLSNVEPGHDIIMGNKVLSCICQSLEAEYAFIQRVDSDRSIVSKFESEYSVQGVQKDDYKRRVLHDIYALLVAPKPELLPMRFGFYKKFEGIKNSARYTLIIPLKLDYPREFIIVPGVTDSQLKYGEVLGHTLISLYKVTNELTNLDVSKIETGLIDETKRDFGQVPYQVYSKRFSMFKDRLEKIYFVYEPVILLDKKDLEIDSWEALARDPDSKNAPVDLFEAAELWGPEFITELDLYCLRNAISNYHALWKQERRGEKIDPLSVNVYPETLYRSAYKKAITHIIKEEGMLKGKKLVLELSEKRRIPDGDLIEDIRSNEDPIDKFVDKLHEYTREVGIGFAIDDFGVGLSSASRLAKFQLDHVKIDRDVLHHQFPDTTIRYVIDLVKRSHFHPVKIVMEGFDGDCNISLATLYNCGIEYVQGYFIRRGSSTVANLDQEKKNYILKLL